MTFLEDIQQRIMLFDGDLQSAMRNTHKPLPGECLEEWNFIRPMDILDAHSAFLAAGADILTANTFGANALRLAPFDLADRADELMQSGVTLCREAAAAQNRPVYVAAAIGPTGAVYTKNERMPRQIYEAFLSQCKAAEEAGADLILIKTMNDLCEARLALLAARKATTLPVLCSFTLEADECTYAGNTPEALALTCYKLGASLIGIDCGFGPTTLFNGYSRLAAACPLSTFAIPAARDTSNAAQELTTLVPAAFAEAFAPYLHSGIAAVGGCCGARPEHIRALRALIDAQHGFMQRSAFDGEFICSLRTRLPLQALEPYTTCSLRGMTMTDALRDIRARVKTETVLHIDLDDWTAEDITKLLFAALPDLQQTPIAFHVHDAPQAKAALFAYPGIAAVYAHGDTYGVLKTVARYGAELLS